MNRSRFLTMLLIFTVWFSTTGFLPLPESQPSLPLAAAPASSSPAQVPGATLSKVSPPNTTQNVPASSVTLSWGSVQGYTGAVTYRYCLQTKQNCPKSKWVRVGTAQSVTVSNLTPDKRYYWWVRAYNSQNVLVAEANGGSWYFNTLPLPGSFVKTAPGQPTINVDTSGVQLTWSETSSNAAHYEYCVDTTNDNRCDPAVGWKQAPSGVVHTGLRLNTNYYWQVRAVNNSGATLANFGTWWTFRTSVVPGVFEKLSPVDNALDQLINGQSLSWIISANAASYQYCINTSPTCAGAWQNVGNVTSTTLGTLTPDTDYYWQVQSVSSTGVTTDANGGVWWKFRTQPPLPGTFSKSAPANLAPNLYTDVTFTWQPSSGAAQYQFCLSTTNNDVNCGDMPWDVVNGTWTTVYGLEVNTTYYWQVRAINYTGSTDANTSTWWSFTTQPNPPLDFTKSAPVDGAAQTNTSLTLTWAPSQTASAAYQVCYDTTDDDACDQDTWRAATTNSTYNLSGLTAGTTYYWQVRAFNAGGTTYGDYDMSAWWSFTTKLAPPSAFGKSTPQTNTATQPLNLTLSWGTSDPGVTYQYCLNSASASCPSEQDWVNATGSSAALTNLNYNTTYYWQVRAKNSEGTITEANNATWWNFKTMLTPPVDFGKSTPENSTTAHPINLTLTWNPSDAGVTYQYCLNTAEAACPAEQNWQNATGSSANPPTLNYNTTYYWQVRAKNSEGTITEANNGTWWQFKTMLPPPASFGKSNPQTNLSGQPLNLTLAWGASDAGVTYQYCIYTAGASCPSEQSWITASGNSASPTGLVYNTTYYWQVRAKNSENTITEANNGTWWQFKTMLAPPTGFGKSEPQNGLSGQPLNPSLSWGVSDTGVTYQYCINTTGAACPSEQGWVTTTGPSANLTGLSYNTTYYWQVRAKNSEDTVTEANEGVWWTFKTMLAPPTGFGKSSPQLDAQNQSQTLALSWGTSDPDVTYEYCVSETSGECPAWESASGTIAHPAGLARETKYYWQVRAKNSEGTTTEADDGAWWYFTTLPYQPAAFNKADPDDGMPQAPRSLTLTWTPSSTPGASYAVCFVVFGTPCEADDWTPVTDPQNASFDVSGLEYGTQYYWQVRAANPGGTTYADGAENAGWSFTTLLAPPAAFNKSEPEYDAKIQPVNLTLTWTTSDLDAAYEVCYDTTVNTTCDSTWEPVPEENGNAFGLTGLENGTTYLWQVRAKNREGTLTEANGGTWWTFKTMLPEPSPFGKTGPRDQATSQPPNPTLEWGGSDPGVTYQYCVSLTDGACDPTPGWVDTSETSAPLSGLAYDTTYYWQVRALNSENTAREANEGAWWSFTTYSQPPEGFVKTSPTNGASNRPLTLNLEWTDAGTGFSYEYCLSETVPFGCAEWESTTATSVEISDLSRGKNYYWQVRAKDSGGHLTPANGQDANPVWQFSTLPNPPSSANVDLPDIPEDQVVSGDLPGANAMTFALYGNQPAGDFRLSASGHFSYDPPQDLNGDVSFQFTVTDNINDPVGPYTVTIHYLSVNDAPVLTPIADIIVYSGETLAFSVVANDVDLLQGTQLTYSIEGLPDSATFDTATGAFRWMPAWVPGAANEVVIVLTVSDGVATQNPVQDTVKITILPRKTFIPIVSR